MSQCATQCKACSCDHCIFVTYFRYQIFGLLVILKPILLTLSLYFIYQSTRLYIKNTVLLWLSAWHYPDTLASPVNHCWNTMVLEAWRQCGWFVGHESRFVSTIVVQWQVSRNLGIIHLYLGVYRESHTRSTSHLHYNDNERQWNVQKRIRP